MLQQYSAPDASSADPSDLPGTTLGPMTGLVFHLIPHTHWDREWYLPLGLFNARLVGMVDDLVDRLTADPGFGSFLLDGQTILLDDYLAARPEQHDAIARLIRAGRLQTGPWYVLADEQVPAGESVIRNLLAGGSTVRRFGGSSSVLYSPDAFGHPAALPQIGREFDLTRGVVWRGLGHQARGKDFIWWQGPDGRRVLTYHLPPDGYEIGAALPSDKKRLPSVWKPVRSILVDRAATRHVALFVGADHHWARPDMSRLRELLAEIESPNEVRISRLDDFLAASEQDLRDIAVLHGELRDSYGYTWTLQGQHGTRAPLKRRNSAAELSLTRLAEPLAALAFGRTEPPDSSGPLLHQAWRELLACQFHDAICGTCSDAVTRALETRFTDVEATVSELTRGSLFALSKHDPDAAREQPANQSPALMVWNPAVRPRGGVVTASLTFFRGDVLVGPTGNRKPRNGPGYRRIAIIDAAGRAIPLQVLGVATGLERLDAKRHYPDLDRVDVVRVAVVVTELGGMASELFGTGSTVGRSDGSSVRGKGGLKTTVGRLDGSSVRRTAESTETVRRFDGSSMPVKVTSRGIRNGLVDLDLAPDGTLSFQVKSTGARFEGLCGLESGGDVGDTYSFCPPQRDRVRRLGDSAARRLGGSALKDSLATSGRSVTARQSGIVSRRIVARGPILGKVEIAGQLRCGRGEGRGLGYVQSRLSVEVRSGEPLVRLTLDIDNQARDHRLRLRFPTGLRGAEAVAGAQFGVVRRAGRSRAGKKTPMEQRVATAPAHRFVALADRTRGLALFAPGFFEYELTPEGDLLITVLRAIGELSRPSLATRPGHAGWPTSTPLAQCLGTSRMELALTAITEGDLASPDRLDEMWENVFVPLQARWIRDFVPGPNHDPRPTTHDSLHLLGEGLVFSTMKRGESGAGIVLRCYNALDRPVAGSWQFGAPIVAATRCRADETRLAPCGVTNNGHVVAFTAGPREIVTVLIHDNSNDG